MKEKLKNHISHNIECEDCNEVLISTQTCEKEQKNSKKEITQIDIVKNLIEAMCNYGLEFSWTDNDVIESLIECGINQQDFNECGYGEFVKEYFEEKED